MRRIDAPIQALIALVAGVALTACGQPSSAPKAKVEAAHVEKGEGDAPNVITLTEHAAQRLGIKTGKVSAAPAGAAKGATLELPASAVYFDAKGEAWVFISTAPLTFAHHPVTVLRLGAKTALLSSGPSVGAEVATVGVPELYGADTGLGY
jgi:hypothetical protein